MDSAVQEVKNRLDIAEVVSSYLKLQRAGANLRGLCPFHAEKSPSFFVSPARQTWHCFGCSRGGDAFKFVQEIEGIEFGDALRLLAQRAGVDLPAYSPRLAKEKSERKRMQDLLELASLFFEKQMASSPKGQEALTYLRDRGVSDESIAKWRLGWAPGKGTALIEFLKTRGHSQGEVERSGLTVRSEGGVYDRFRSRIMFPVCDQNGVVIGFGGRIFGEKEGGPPAGGLAKYINTPNTLLYDKSRVLYGLDKAKVECRRQDSCLLVEGYMDAIMVSQAGFLNVVAVSGTALTQQHLNTLKRYSNNLTLSFDMDSAGDAATKRGIDLALSQGFSLRVVVMPQGKDPADVAKDAEQWKALVAGATSILDFFFATTLSRFDAKTAEGKRAIGNELIPVIKKIANKIEQAHWARKLATELNVPEQSVTEELKAFTAPKQEYQRGREEPLSVPVPKTRRDLLEERTLALMFLQPLCLELITDDHMAFLSLRMQEIMEGLRKVPSLEFRQLEGIFEQSTLEFLQYVALKGEVYESPAGGAQDMDREFRSCLLELELLFVRSRLDVLSQAIRQAEAEHDTKLLESLLNEFNELSRQLS
ncbi:MAG: DNA primase [Parcubacteria group bacterium]|nr:DNA primase [Parcubacteria group bacterium]